MYNNNNDDDIKQRVKQKAKNVACLQASLRAYKEKGLVTKYHNVAAVVAAAATTIACVYYLLNSKSIIIGKCLL